MLDLHYWPTPNGKKVTIQLEECGLPYNVVPCNNRSFQRNARLETELILIRV